MENRELLTPPLRSPVRVPLLIAYMGAIAVMANINALVDHLLHPDIGYFDPEHLIVGGITALATALIFGLFIIYHDRLTMMIRQLKSLEPLLPICAHCKKVRLPNRNPDDDGAWQTIESFISAETQRPITHGVCPSCRKEHFPWVQQDTL